MANFFFWRQDVNSKIEQKKPVGGNHTFGYYRNRIFPRHAVGTGSEAVFYARNRCAACGGLAQFAR